VTDEHRRSAFARLECVECKDETVLRTMHPRTLVIVLGWDEVIALDAELLGDVVQVVGPGRIDVDPQELPLLERLDDML